MADIKGFIKKYDGKTLSDWGGVVSPEFKSFQTCFINAVKKIAASIGGEVVNASKGHYDVCGFIKKGNKYVYFDYSNGCGYGGRTHIILTNNNHYSKPLLIRRARHDKDWTGLTNHFCAFEDMETNVEQLFDMDC